MSARFTAMGIRSFGIGAIGFALLATLPAATPASAKVAAVSNPAAYCRTVGNQDSPPGGDRAPASMARAAGITGHTYTLWWRCSAGQVLVCGTEDMHEVGCSKRDRRQRAEIPEYCREQPNARSIPYAAGNRRSVYEWRCRGTVPAIVTRYIAEHELDAAGYVKGEWIALAPARAAAPRVYRQVNTEVIAPARVRNHPTANGSVVLKVLHPGGTIRGEWVPADDSAGHWLRVDLDGLEVESPWPYGYVWEGNLKVLP